MRASVRPMLRSGPAVLALVVGVGAGVGAGSAWGESVLPHHATIVADRGAAPTPGDAAPLPAVDGPHLAALEGDPASERADGGASRSVREAEEVEPPESLEPTPVEPAPEVPEPDPEPEEEVVPDVDPGSGLLGTDVETDLGGDLEVVPGSSEAPGDGTVRTVRVEVEVGLPVDGAVFADAVLTTLNDPRGWGPTDGVTFARTDSEPDYRVVLASPATTDRMCAPLDTRGVYSCANTGSAVLNFDRWVNASPDFDDDTETYRHYLVNHEVGHLLGKKHVDCPAEGELAPVMVQQSISTQGCLPNGWPNP